MLCHAWVLLRRVVRGPPHQAVLRGWQNREREPAGAVFGCHRNLHQGLLKITPQPDGTLIFTDSKGRRLDHQANLELAGWLDQHQGWPGGEFDSHYARLHQGEWAVF